MNPSTRTFSILACLGSAVALSACSDSSNGDAAPPMPTDDAAMAPLDEAALVQLEGIFEQRGYGDLFAFADNRTTLYSLTQDACLEVASFPGLAGLAEEEVARTRYQLDGDVLTLDLPGSAFVTRYTRMDTLPPRCNDTVARDAQSVFDYTWATFDEYYAFFDVRDVDWQAEYARVSPRVAEATDDDALFDVLSDLISRLDDDHVFLETEDDGFAPSGQGAVAQELIAGFQAQTEFDDVNDYADDVYDRFQTLLVSRLDGGDVQQEGSLYWGTLEDGATGYMFLEAMAGFVLDADGDFDEEATEADELAAAAAAMDEAMADLATTSRMVIDIRVNGGGHDAISFEFARRFVSERQLAFSKTARSRDFETAPVQAWLEPVASGGYLNPVTLIIGSDTVSAAETFAIPMSRLPQVTLIGETTSGALSDILFKPLPNGWAVELSNEVYLDSEGVSYEGIGLTPQIEVPVFRVADIDAGVDPALDVALSMGAGGGM